MFWKERPRNPFNKPGEVGVVGFGVNNSDPAQNRNNS